MKTLYTGRLLVYKNLHDGKLALLTTGGDNIAFDCIMLRYLPRIFHFLLSELRNTADAHDLTQETFLAALLALRNGKYKNENKLLHWLYGIARKCLSHFRHYKMMFSFITSLQGQDYPEDLPSDNNLLLRLRFGKALHQMSRLYRLVIILHYFKKLTFREIGLRLHIPLNTATSNCFKARRRMRQILKTPF